MKILFIADILPGLQSGSAVRNYYLLKALSQKHAVDFVGLTNDKSTLNKKIYTDLLVTNPQFVQREKISLYQRILYLIKGSIPYVQQRRRIILPKQIINKLGEYDAIHLAELNSYFFMEKYIEDIKVPIVLDAHNVEYIRFSSEIAHAPLFTKYIGRLLSKRLKSMEVQMLQKITHLCVCSSVDKAYFQMYFPNDRITIIPNGVDIQYYTVRNKIVHKKNNIILFMGLLSYFPNNEGLHYYFSKIHPVIKKSILNLKFHIIGKEAPKWLEEMATKDKSITLLGFVEDTRPYIAAATVCIAPLLSGSGTRLKILEYMAMTKAVVATLKAAEGIAVTDKRDILLASNTKEFIQGILSIFDDQKLCESLEVHAQKLVQEKYAWKSIGTELASVYSRL